MRKRFAAGLGDAMESEFDDREQKIIDRYLQSSFALWGALLTVNGVLLAAYSAVYSVFQNAGILIILFLIGACVLSLILLVWNFWATKATYFRIGQVVTDNGRDLSEETMRRDTATANSRHKWVTWRERGCLLLLAIEVALVIAIVIGVGSRAGQ